MLEARRLNVSHYDGSGQMQSVSVLCSNSSPSTYLETPPILQFNLVSFLRLWGGRCHNLYPVLVTNLHRWAPLPMNVTWGWVVVWCFNKELYNNRMSKDSSKEVWAKTWWGKKLRRQQSPTHNMLFFWMLGIRSKLPPGEIYTNSHTHTRNHRPTTIV